MFKRFPFYRQMDQMDCGPSCLRMIAKHYGATYSLQQFRELCHIDREGVSLEGMTYAAEQIGMETLAVKIRYETEDEEEASLLDVPLPCIAHWQQRHFLVAYKVTKRHVWVADPAKGRLKLSREAFEQSWTSEQDYGILLLLGPTEKFEKGDKTKATYQGFGFLVQYFKPYYRLLAQLFLGLFLGSIFQLIFPFLTQAIVDVGVKNQNIGFVYLILIAQLMLFLGQMTVNIIQNWILLHISTRINVNLIADFLVKLIRLPIAFFDTKMIGDLLQRIQDHDRIEKFLTNSTLTAIFSFVNLLIFSLILLIYDLTIFIVFISFSILYILWVVIFLRRRRVIDYMQFEQQAENRSALIELIQGMQEIKLQNSEKKRRWQWTNIQAKLFKISIDSLAITQYQDLGAAFISQLKDIIISFIAASAVISGDLTLGMMLAVQYIIGQLNAPLQQMINFVRIVQDTRISLERLGEIHSREEEVDQDNQGQAVPASGDLVIKDLKFRYNLLADDVLEDINLIIPQGKVTAIVGGSGSGKTTLVKLLLGFYKPVEGSIHMAEVPLGQLNKREWRQSCGAVLQDGFLFSDSIANNIAESEDTVERTKLLKAVKTANIQDFIESLPEGYNTEIGGRGSGLSQGQRQRLLIARAVYKDPRYLFFDEATNALDTENEKIIMQNLDAFFENRTVVVVAHRLSTVKNADQIVVLNQGRIVELGKHEELIAARGLYYQLVKNQLELGQ
ncbi:MAG: peptidase domain-containing ABC transporter [Bacteroidota bacterium]